MKKENCTYYDNGHCKKGLPGTWCYPVGCVAMTDKPIESLNFHYPLRPTALTWQDIKTIVEIADNIANQGIEKWVGYQDEYYKAVLEEFNKTRK